MFAHELFTLRTRASAPSAVSSFSNCERSAAGMMDKTSFTTRSRSVPHVPRALALELGYWRSNLTAATYLQLWMRRTQTRSRIVEIDVLLRPSGGCVANACTSSSSKLEKGTASNCVRGRGLGFAARRPFQLQTRSRKSFDSRVKAQARSFEMSCFRVGFLSGSRL